MSGAARAGWINGAISANIQLISCDRLIPCYTTRR
jgi:hypothetical protein